MTEKTRPLAALKIVVTRPRDQSIQLAHGVERAGGVPVLFPLLDIAAVTDKSTLYEQISRLDRFDLAVFVSPNAVRYGIGVIRERRAVPATLRIATVGEGSAKALRELGINSIIVPTERFDSEGLLALPELQQVAGWRILIFRGESGRELLGDTFRARGASVEYATCYQRSKPHQDIGALLEASPDAITVTSSEALDHLWQLLGSGEPAALLDIPLFVSHTRIAERAAQQGWRKIVLAGAGDEGMLSSLIDWAGKLHAA